MQSLLLSLLLSSTCVDVTLAGHNQVYGHCLCVMQSVGPQESLTSNDPMYRCAWGDPPDLPGGLRLPLALPAARCLSRDDHRW